jgi:hypothetical protein
VLDVETYWHLETSGGQTLTCQLHRTTAGLYVRCGFDVDNPIRSEIASTLAAAYCIATSWKKSALDQGFSAADV